MIAGLASQHYGLHDTALVYSAVIAALVAAAAAMTGLRRSPRRAQSKWAWRRAGFAQSGVGRVPDPDLPFPCYISPDYLPSPLPLSGLLGLAP